jgi:uncharacterized membrane protein YbaN (DUF454 family)
VIQSTVQELRIVHSSFGRLRVHLPDAQGQIAAQVRGFAGVTCVESSEITGNMLILFNARQASEDSLMAQLHTESGIPLPLPEPSESLPAVLDDGAVSSDGAVAGYVTGARRLVYKALGWASVGMAVVGAITPGIPTVPFVLLAGYFFVRSSPEAHRWLRETRWFGPIVRNWEEHRAITRRMKKLAIGLIVASMVIVVLLNLPTWVLATILVLDVIGLAVVMSLRVVEEVETAPVALS